MGYTTETPGRSGPLDPAGIRTVNRMWASHRDGASWADIGEDLGMGPTGVEVAFNALIARARRADQRDLAAVDEMYRGHYPTCSDCDGPNPRSVMGTQAPSPGGAMHPAPD